MQMRLYWPVVLGLVALVALPLAREARAGTPTAADRKALAALVQELDAAYGAQDADRFSALFSEDGNFQFPVEGTVMHGREEIRQHFAKQFATLPPLQHVTTTGEVDVVRPGLLAVDIQVDIRATDRETGAMRTLFHYTGMGLGIHTHSGWRIRLVRLYPATK